MKRNREYYRKRRHMRHRKQIVGTAERPRLAVRRTQRHTYAQLIDDASGRTLGMATTDRKDVSQGQSKNHSNIADAKLVGAAIAEAAKAAGVTRVVFDCGGGRYHGAVKALAESARENGLEF